MDKQGKKYIQNNILISAIIPIYNAEEHLIKCVESIRKQTYKNFEIILVDDGSIDNSAAICKDLKRLDKRITFIRKKNQGVSSARNLGIDLAKGEYLVFIDADDTIVSIYFEELIKVIQVANFDLVFSGYHRVKKNKNIEVCTIDKNITGNILNDFYKIRNFIYTPWAKIYKKDIIINNKIRFPVECTDAEDQIFNFIYLKYVKQYFFINKPLYNYFCDNILSLSKLTTIASYKSNLKKVKFEKIFLENNNLKYKEYLLTNECLNILRRYVKISDINDSYLLYKNRVKEIKEIMYNFKSYKNYKEFIILVFLKYNIFFPLYIYWMFNKYKEEFKIKMLK